MQRRSPMHLDGTQAVPNLSRSELVELVQDTKVRSDQIRIRSSSLSSTPRTTGGSARARPPTKKNTATATAASTAACASAARAPPIAAWQMPTAQCSGPKQRTSDHAGDQVCLKNRIHEGSPKKFCLAWFKPKYGEKSLPCHRFSSNDHL